MHEKYTPVNHEHLLTVNIEAYKAQVTKQVNEQVFRHDVHLWKSERVFIFDFGFSSNGTKKINIF